MFLSKCKKSLNYFMEKNEYDIKNCQTIPIPVPIDFKLISFRIIEIKYFKLLFSDIVIQTLRFHFSCCFTLKKKIINIE